MATKATCRDCSRPIEADFRGKKLGAHGFCVGFHTCLVDFSLTPSNIEAGDLVLWDIYAPGPPDAKPIGSTLVKIRRVTSHHEPVIDPVFESHAIELLVEASDSPPKEWEELIRAGSLIAGADELRRIAPADHDEIVDQLVNA